MSEPRMMTTEEVPDQETVPERHLKRIERWDSNRGFIAKQGAQFSGVEAGRLTEKLLPEIGPAGVCPLTKGYRRTGLRNKTDEPVLTKVHRDVMHEDREHESTGVFRCNGLPRLVPYETLGRLKDQLDVVNAVVSVFGEEWKLIILYPGGEFLKG
jgi:hypothetical protein